MNAIHRTSQVQFEHIQVTQADIGEIQQRFAASMEQLRLDDVIAEVKTGHQAIAPQLGDALTEAQDQDVMRQRVEHVEQALSELDQHLQAIARQVIDGPWDPDAMSSMKDRLQAQAGAYVMHAQRQTHRAITGAETAAVRDEPKIELF